jgi:glycosyltransferase involved in cell wall biosynthesis
MLAESRRVGDRITWIGMQNEDAKWGAYGAADGLVLTSHSENLGVVIAEALACGLPVFLGDNVNIWREIERCGAGLVDDDTAAGATSLLDRWMNLSDSDRAEMRRRARACFLDNFEARGAAMGFVTSIAGMIGKADVA